jgi:hypothetical protein
LRKGEAIDELDGLLGVTLLTETLPHDVPRGSVSDFGHAVTIDQSTEVRMNGCTRLNPFVEALRSSVQTIIITAGTSQGNDRGLQSPLREALISFIEIKSSHLYLFKWPLAAFHPSSAKVSLSSEIMYF